MSLINKMLQDLESRRADDRDRPLPSDVRPLPPQGRHSVPWLRIALGAMVAVLVGGGGAAWYLTRQAETGFPASGAPAASRKGPASSSAAGVVGPPRTPATSPTVVAPPAPVQPSPTPAASPTPVAPPAPVQSSATLAAAEPDGPRPSEVPDIPVSRDAAAPDGARKSGLKLATAIDVPVPKNLGDSPWLARPGSLPKKARPAPAQPPSIQKQARASTPQERADADYRHAVALMNEGRTTDSQETLRGALREDPAHAQARLLLVGMLVEQKRLDEAQVVLQQGLDRDPAQPPFAMRLARIQVERGDSTAAAGTLLRAAPAATGNAEFRGFHAAVLQRLARHKEAVLEYQAALRLSPQSGVWWMGLGISLEADARPAEARDAFQRARATRTLSPELDRFVDQKLRQLH